MMDGREEPGRTWYIAVRRGTVRYGTVPVRTTVYQLVNRLIRYAYYTLLKYKGARVSARSLSII